MINQTIIVKHSKEDLRKYNIFSSFKRRTFRRIMFFAAPIIGVMGALTSILLEPDNLLLGLSLFLIVYPFLIRYILIRQSDRIYNTNNLVQFPNTLTFTETELQIENETANQTLKYEDFYEVFNTKNELVLYVSKVSGLYILKEKYTETEIENIFALIKNAIPNKIKGSK